MPEPARQDRHVRHLDARSLRGLAHPLRMQLLDSLRFSGPATASQLAERLGESSGATSYHLRQLAAHGFVEDAPERGKGRERWWRAADDGLYFDDALFTDASPAVRGAVDMVMHQVATKHTQELYTWLGNRHTWPQEWVPGTDMSDMTLRLTPRLANELIEKMHALVESYRDLPEAVDAPDAERVRIHTHTFPISTD
ncbi:MULTISPECIES: ArsR/SmtB family transcription factor [unclassified Streptomyces]|uniref:ArsR/SmtB family transcription factor n=1 Tax=unclassified Streptomyces TaxID=2593676 RepID=UPI00225BA342|nr:MULTISPECIES: winged helix-turn-helix domain-containing protein [unclassified Streptomyces]MCX5048510.1 winged helix-turn-helix domain-containing protein [Streptomyces sp. NBC_00474]